MQQPPALTPQQQAIQEVRRRLKKFNDLRVNVRGTRSSINAGGADFEFDLALLGPELDALYNYAEQLRKRAPELGLVDADITLKMDKPELRIEIDRARAADLGVDTEDIASSLRVMVGGDPEVSRFYDPSINGVYDVQLRLAEQYRKEPARFAVGVVRVLRVVEIPERTAAADRRHQVEVVLRRRR